MAKGKKAETAPSAPDVNASPTNTGRQRKKISRRELFTVNGGKAESMIDATGAAYVVLDNNGTSAGEVEYTFGADATVDRMFALFGFFTKVGNVVNSVLNDREDPGSPAEAAQAATEFMQQVARGVWREAGTSEGPRTHLPTLAQAIDQWMVGSNRASPGSEAILHNLQNGNSKGVSGADLVKRYRGVPEIKALYARLRGAPQVDVAQLADDFD